MSPALAYPIFAALIGLVMGSAVTAIAWRIPRGVSWARGRSACPACGATLRAADLVPLLSFALGRGRCRHCRAPIGWRYPLTELWCGAWAVLAYLHVGPGWLWPPLALWGFLLVALFWVDLDHQLLPDVLTFPGTLIAIAYALQIPGGARRAILGIALGSGLLWLLAWIWIRFRKIEGLGGGDIKLAAMFGALLGWPLTLVTLFLAALAGSLWGGWLIARGRGDGKTALPFGVLLAPAAMIAYLWGEGWLAAYVRLLGRG